ncbi:unnamed protein product [Dovyalis caffra]|uniref:ABC transmembrane type-1 domain-containing protein n=1 Tax=Dovyalis caffra TaxID=77055 RepID=A0AAV1R8U0_9ROSI|nr:unnamed protein product [Dovyalis caffra]
MKDYHTIAREKVVLDGMVVENDISKQVCDEEISCATTADCIRALDGTYIPSKCTYGTGRKVSWQKGWNNTECELILDDYVIEEIITSSQSMIMDRTHLSIREEREGNREWIAKRDVMASDMWNDYARPNHEKYLNKKIEIYNEMMLVEARAAHKMGGQYFVFFGSKQVSTYHHPSSFTTCRRIIIVRCAVTLVSSVSCWMVTGERQAARIRNLYLEAILRQEIGFFDKETSTREIIGRMSGDTILIQDAMGEKMASRGQTAYSHAANLVDQTIGSIRTICTIGQDVVDQCNKSLTEAVKNGVQEGLVIRVGYGVFALIVFSTYALAAWFGAKMILNEGYSGGSLGQSSSCLSAFASGPAAAFKMFEVIDHRKSQIDSYKTNGRMQEDIQGDIELKDIHFSYPARLDEQIFNGFSLTIPNGATAALVGESRSGKSTVIGLIERFYDPQADEVLIDGINLKEFQLHRK